MARTALISDDEVIEAVDLVRADFGACTYAKLAEQLGMKRAAVQYRVDRLVKAGRLETSEIAGSIRRAPSP